MNDSQRAALDHRFLRARNRQPLHVFFFFNDTATTEIYTVSDTLSLHDALPISRQASDRSRARTHGRVRAPTSAERSEEHTSELQSPDTISYAVFCLKKKKKNKKKKEKEINNKKTKIKR